MREGKCQRAETSVALRFCNSRTYSLQSYIVRVHPAKVKAPCTSCTEGRPSLDHMMETNSKQFSLSYLDLAASNGCVKDLSEGCIPLRLSMTHNTTKSCARIMCIISHKLQLTL